MKQKNSLLAASLLLLQAFVLNAQQPAVDSLKATITTATPDTLRAKTYLSLSEACTDTAAALDWARRLNAFAAEKELPAYRWKALLREGRIYSAALEFEKARRLYRQALAISSRQKDYAGMAEAWLNLEVSHIDGGSPRDSVELYFAKVLALKDVLNDKLPLGKAYYNYASKIVNLGEYHAAMDNVMQALKIYEKAGYTKGRLMSKNLLASIEFYQGNYAKAIAMFEEITPGFLKLKLSRQYATSIQNLASCYDRTNQPHKAMPYFRLAIALGKKQGNLKNTIMAYYNASLLKSGIGEADSGLYFGQQIVHLSEQLPEYLPLAHFVKALAYLRKNNYAKSEEELQQYMAGKGNRLSLVDKLSAYKLYAELYDKWGRYQKASLYYSMALGLKDSLYTEEDAAKMADMEAWYWSSQKKNELSLAKKNAELKAKEALQAGVEKSLYASQRNALVIGLVLLLVLGILLYRINLQRRKNKLLQQVTDLELKAIRAQMNPHFMFNALSAIQMLINKNDIRQSNLALARFGKLMRFILENSERQTISIEDEIQTLQLYIELEAIRFPFHYQLDIDPELDRQNMRIPSMLIQPYVENAIKHGLSPKAENRNMKISFKRMNENCCCTVEDDGIGREAARSAQSRYARHKSMGTKLSEERLDLISKKMTGRATVVTCDLTGEDGLIRGTRVELSMPITYHTN